MISVEDRYYRSANVGVTLATHSYKAGDRVLVLVGDTLVPAVIEGACQIQGGSESEWSVRWNGAGQVYQIPESFLRLHVTSPA